MSHPEYLFNYFCPVNLSFLILKYYRTVVIQKSKMRVCQKYLPPSLNII